MKKIFLLLALACLYYSASYGYNSLYVQDPRNTWRYCQGSIDEATFTVKPKGIYMEYGIYLTFSAKSDYCQFTNQDTLEVQYLFEIPANAIVTDSWLWIGDKIVQASIQDQWTAASTYEGIVKRRRDPSILYKRGNGNYELRIFPMAGNETRKVKISYLVPATWSASSVSAPLPLQLLNASYFKPTLNLNTYPDSTWKHPSLPELPADSFHIAIDKILGKYEYTHVQPSEFDKAVSISFDSPLKKGVFLNTGMMNNEGFYELVLLPSQSLSLNLSKKVCILLDYELSKSTTSFQDLLPKVKQMMLDNFTPSDSFNLFYTKLSVIKMSPKWLPAHPDTISKIFNIIKKNHASSYSNLPILLSEGLEFIKSTGKDGSLLLISDSDQFGNSVAANQLISDLKAIQNPLPPIHIADFQNTNFQNYYVNNEYMFGNQYLYSNLARTSGANFFNTVYTGIPIDELLSSAFIGLNGSITSFDLYTSLENGFCYGRHGIGPTADIVNISQPVFQTGKYSGNFPFMVQVSGLSHSKPFFKKIAIEKDEIHFQNDSSVAKGWAGNYIQIMESNNQTNQNIQEIIEYSLNYRVLSLYTAFLAIENADTTAYCKTCVDESNVATETIEKIADSTSISISPNPLVTHSEITLHLPYLKTKDHFSILIYDMMGNIVRTFDQESVNEQGKLTVIWDGVSDSGIALSNGNYFLVVNTEFRTYKDRVVILK